MSKKILIVEDDNILSNTLSLALNDEGYTVFQAYDGEQGLKMAENEKPDLILCDINMPIMDGITMLEKVREADWGKYLNFMILTNSSDELKIYEVLKNSVFSYLVKSDWDLDTILKKIKEELKD
ncbi:MAG: response regulator [Patescibacteria group bacterium]